MSFVATGAALVLSPCCCCCFLLSLQFLSPLGRCYRTAAVTNTISDKGHTDDGAAILPDKMVVALWTMAQPPGFAEANFITDEQERTR